MINYSNYVEQRKNEEISKLKKIIKILPNIKYDWPINEIQDIKEKTQCLIEKIQTLEGPEVICITPSISANWEEILNELKGNNPNSGINTLKALLNILTKEQ
jgi:hypothetical protein